MKEKLFLSALMAAVALSAIPAAALAQDKKPTTITTTMTIDGAWLRHVRQLRDANRVA